MQTLGPPRPTEADVQLRNICRGFSSSANRTRRPRRVRTSGELDGFLPLIPPPSLGTADPLWSSPGPKTTGSLPGTACARAGQMVVGVASNVPRKAKSNAKGPDFSSSVSAAALRTQNRKRVLISAVAAGRQGSQVRTTSHQARKTSESGVRKAAEDTAFQSYRKKDGGTRMEPNCRARKQK